MKILRKMAFASGWTKIRQMHVVLLPVIFKRYMKRKREIEKEHKIDRCVRKVVTMLRKSINGTGEKLDEEIMNKRKIKTWSFTFTFLSQLKIDRAQIEAKETLRHFFKSQAWVLDFKFKAVKCYELIVVIQDKWRLIKRRRNIQKKVVEYMWDKEMGVIEQYCLKHKSNKNKKTKQLYQKVVSIDKEIKDKILSNYMELRRCIHWVTFAKWRLNQLSKEREDFTKDKGKNNKILARMNSGIKMEDDYLDVLLKFKSIKARLIKIDLFKGVEPGILEIEQSNNVTKEKIEKPQKTAKKKQELFKGKREARGSVISDVLFHKGNDYYCPLDKVDESVFTSDKNPTYTFKPNRETMHMMIKKATLVKTVHALFCENYDGYKKMDVQKIEEESEFSESDSI